MELFWWALQQASSPATSHVLLLLLLLLLKPCSSSHYSSQCAVASWISWTLAAYTPPLPPKTIWSPIFCFSFFVWKLAHSKSCWLRTLLGTNCLEGKEGRSKGTKVGRKFKNWRKERTNELGRIGVGAGSVWGSVFLFLVAACLQI